VRCKLRLHYARLYAGGIVDLQSKFVLVPQLELTRAVAQTVPVFFLTLPFLRGFSISYPLRVLPLKLKRESFSCFICFNITIVRGFPQAEVIS
jgi:hypothetical protein